MGTRVVKVVFDDLPLSELNPNNLRRTHWAVRSEASQVARQEAFILGRNLRIPPPPIEHFYLDITFVLPTRRKLDLEGQLGACKPWVDGLVDAKLIAEDDWTHLLRISGGARYDKGKKATEVYYQRGKGIMAVTFGWRKDTYDARDYLHKVKVVKLPTSVMLTEQLTPLRDQGSIGSCIGFGVGINVNSVRKKLGIFTEWESPTWIYNGCRFMEGTLDRDAGAYPRDAFEWLLNSGTLLESFWPYDGAVLDKSAPSSTRMAQAVKYPNFAYYRVVDSVGGICSALAEGHFVSIGAPWFGKWYNAPGGILAEVTAEDGVVGGHETALIGFNQDKAVFYGVNSWGESWGDKGFYTMPFSAIEVFKKLGGYDAHYLTFEPLTPPEPTPTPEPEPVPDPEPAPVPEPIPAPEPPPPAPEPTPGPAPEPTPEPPPVPTPSKCRWGKGIAGALNIGTRVMKRRGRFYYLNPDGELR